MNKEDLKQKLKDEGFVHIYEWTDAPGTEYPEHKHKGKVSFYVIEGSIDMKVNGVDNPLVKGDRIDVPVGASHRAKVGPGGCTFLVGEEIEGDS